MKTRQNTLGECNTQNKFVLEWVRETAELCQPARIFWCNGSEYERRTLTDAAVQAGVLIRLNQEKLPGCYYHRSNPNDVARVEESTFICTREKELAGPTNNWIAPGDAYRKLRAFCAGAMQGRTMYVVPYLMGPPGSSMTKVGLEITDSIYVVLSMGIMTRMGDLAYAHLRDSNDFNRGLHCMLDVAPERRCIAHFPEDNQIISVGSNYGGNVLLGKKCFALRIASYLGQQQGWFAEHMLILCVESPEGEKTYVGAAFPSACGKTNFSMMVPPARYAGWKVRTIGDDIAWLAPGRDGRLYAINPEAGYFGVVPGTNSKSNPNGVQMISKNTIYTNVALTSDLDVWWEGKDGPVPKECFDWRGNKWTPDSKERAAHPNSRFTVPMTNNPVLASEVNDPHGVPLSAVIFGGRRTDTVPLVYQAFNWEHGVYLGATMSSETTAAATGGVGQIRRDPMAMLPFCGYHVGDYFQHWIDLRQVIKHPPEIFHVNWFRKNGDGRFLWPGFGENMRVLKWVVDRCCGRIEADESPLGWVPNPETFDLDGIDGFSRGQFQHAQTISEEDWRKEIVMQEEFFAKLYPHVPKELILQRELLAARL